MSFIPIMNVPPCCFHCAVGRPLNHYNRVLRIAKALGMDLIPVRGATGDTDTDLTAKVAATLQAAQKYPFVLLHINGADEAAHRKHATEKKQFLKRVDEQVLAKLLNSPHRVTVVSDHGTDPANGLHLGDKQPVFVNDQEEGRLKKSNDV